MENMEDFDELEQDQPKRPSRNWGAKSVSSQAPKPVKKQQPDTITNGRDIPDCIDEDEFDIDNPPGLAGKIVQLMRLREDRKLENGAYSAGAMQILAMAGSDIAGLNGAKNSFISLTLAVSGGGKGNPQEVIQQCMASCGLPLPSDIRSDKDIVRSLIKTDGKAFFIIDEAHKVFASKPSAPGQIKKQDDPIVTLLTELVTSKLFTLGPGHQEEYAKRLEDKLMLLDQRAAKKIQQKNKLDDGPNGVDIEKAAPINADLKLIEQEIKKIQQKLFLLETGYPRPAVNIAAYSTPENLGSIINAGNVDSGFMGRCLIVDCGTERNGRDESYIIENLTRASDPELTKKHEVEENLLMQSITSSLKKIKDIGSRHDKETVEREMMSDYQAKLRLDASIVGFWAKVFSLYETQAFINSKKAGALYARLQELTMKYAGILALGEEDLTVRDEHMRWAFMISIMSIRKMIPLISINATEESTDIETLLSACAGDMARILRSTKKKPDADGGWFYFSSLIKDIKNSPKKPYKRALELAAKENQNLLLLMGQFMSEYGLEGTDRLVRLKP